jgi:hypothetical protein
VPVVMAFYIVPASSSAWQGALSDEKGAPGADKWVTPDHTHGPRSQNSPIWVSPYFNRQTKAPKFWSLPNPLSVRDVHRSPGPLEKSRPARCRTNANRLLAATPAETRRAPRGWERKSAFFFRLSNAVCEASSLMRL